MPDCSTAATRAAAPVLTDEEFEELVRSHWRRREPGHDDVTFTVHRRGRVVRVVTLLASGRTVTLPAATATGGLRCEPAAAPLNGTDPAT